MKAWCKYCRAMTAPAPSHPGRPRVCRNCLRPYEPGGEISPTALVSAPAYGASVTAPSEPIASPMALTAPQGHAPSLPTPGPEQGERSRGDQGAPRATQTVSGVICPYLRNRNNEQTVHLIPHKRNACYARLRRQDRWWSPWVEIAPTPVTRQYQACFCFGPYVRCPYFRPVGVSAPAMVREGNREHGCDTQGVATEQA
jgi:hypothetical protein